MVQKFREPVAAISASDRRRRGSARPTLATIKPPSLGRAETPKPMSGRSSRASSKPFAPRHAAAVRSDGDLCARAGFEKYNGSLTGKDLHYDRRLQHVRARRLAARAIGNPAKSLFARRFRRADGCISTFRRQHAGGTSSARRLRNTTGNVNSIIDCCRVAADRPHRSREEAASGARQEKKQAKSVRRIERRSENKEGHDLETALGNWRGEVDPAESISAPKLIAEHGKRGKPARDYVADCAQRARMKVNLSQLEEVENQFGKEF